MCSMPTLVCIITRLPWHFSLTTSELQTKGDLYFDICSVFVTSMLPITVGIYIYGRICRKLTKQRLGENARNHATRSPSAIFAINMMKESMMKSIMYACVTTSVTWLLLIIAKLSSILLSSHVHWILAYFKVLIIFTNPLCEGICMSSKKENIASLYRRHFKSNRVDIGNHASTTGKTFDTDMATIRKPQLSLSVVDEEEEKSSPAKSDETNDPQTEETAVNTVAHRFGQDLAVCSLPETCACSACTREKLESRLHQNRSPSWPHSSKQTEKDESVSETLNTEVTTSSFKTCDTGILPVRLPRHNSDGTCRIGQLSPATKQTKIVEVGHMRSEISLSLDTSIFFPDEQVRLSPYPHSSYKPYNLDLPTNMLTGIAINNFDEKCYTQQGGKDRAEKASTTSDIANFNNTPLSLSRHSEDTVISSGNEDSLEKTKQSSAITNFLYRPRRSLNSRHVPGNAYPVTRLNRMNTFYGGTAQPDGKSSCGSLELQYAGRGHSRRGSKLSQQGSVYSLSSFCPSLKSVTSVTSGYADLFESKLFQNCPSNKSDTSLESQKKLLSSLSDFF